MYVDPPVMVPLIVISETDRVVVAVIVPPASMNPLFPVKSLIADTLSFDIGQLILFYLSVEFMYYDHTFTSSSTTTSMLGTITTSTPSSM